MPETKRAAAMRPVLFHGGIEDGTRTNRKYEDRVEDRKSAISQSNGTTLRPRAPLSPTVCRASQHESRQRLQPLATEHAGRGKQTILMRPELDRVLVAFDTPTGHHPADPLELDDLDRRLPKTRSPIDRRTATIADSQSSKDPIPGANIGSSTVESGHAPGSLTSWPRQHLPQISTD